MKKNNVNEIFKRDVQEEVEDIIEALNECICFDCENDKYMPFEARYAIRRLEKLFLVNHKKEK